MTQCIHVAFRRNSKIQALKTYCAPQLILIGSDFVSLSQIVLNKLPSPLFSMQHAFLVSGVELHPGFNLALILALIFACLGNWEKGLDVSSQEELGSFE